LAIFRLGVVLRARVGRARAEVMLRVRARFISKTVEVRAVASLNNIQILNDTNSYF
jgi:hypothetical protein